MIFVKMFFSSTEREIQIPSNLNWSPLCMLFVIRGLIYSFQNPFKKKKKNRWKMKSESSQNLNLHVSVQSATGSSSLNRRVFSRARHTKLFAAFAGLDPCTFLPS